MHPNAEEQVGANPKFRKLRENPAEFAKQFAKIYTNACFLFFLLFRFFRCLRLAHPLKQNKMLEG